MKTIKWINELDNVQSLLEEGLSVKDIAKHYNVTFPRMYQVLTKFNIPTPTRTLPSLFRGKEPKVYWLNQILSMKGIKAKERHEILNSLDIPDYCPILGIKLNYSGTGFRRDDTCPSVDRIDSNGEYVLGNIHVISWRANRIKNDSTPEELQKIATYMKNLTSS